MFVPFQAVMPPPQDLRVRLECCTHPVPKPITAMLNSALANSTLMSHTVKKVYFSCNLVTVEIRISKLTNVNLVCVDESV